jgi:hypothetical protein
MILRTGKFLRISVRRSPGEMSGDLVRMSPKNFPRKITCIYHEWVSIKICTNLLHSLVHELLQLGCEVKWQPLAAHAPLHQLPELVGAFARPELDVLVDVESVEALGHTRHHNVVFRGKLVTRHCRSHPHVQLLKTIGKRWSLTARIINHGLVKMCGFFIVPGSATGWPSSLQPLFSSGIP